MARKTKLTPERHKMIIETLKLGNFVTTAGALAGVSDEAIRRWVTRGEEEAEAGKDNAYTRFAADFLEATGIAESTHVACIAQGAMKDWRAAAWWLERRFPEKWGERKSLNVNANVATTWLELMKNTEEGKGEEPHRDE